MPMYVETVTTALAYCDNVSEAAAAVRAGREYGCALEISARGDAKADAVRALRVAAREAGWRVGGGRWLCPGCAAASEPRPAGGARLPRGARGRARR